MKKIIFSTVFFALVALTSFSQPGNDLPTATALIHYKLSVGYHTTTVLIFPSPVQQADRGERDLMAQKQPGIENVLKVKTARKDFPPTNLHVFTADGRVYAFDVVYLSDPMQTTYDLTMLSTADSLKGQVELYPKPLDRQKLASNVAKVKASKPFFSSQTCKYRMAVQLQTIYHSDNRLYLGFKLINKSTLPYDIEFVRLYIQDHPRIKRSSIQQRELVPVYKDSIISIPGKSSVPCILVIPKLTIPAHRQLVWVIQELNGGRTLSFDLKNAQLLRSKALD